jgi:arylsulfatase A-like enzyme
MWQVVVVFFMLGACQWVAARPPNILFILADDLGYGDLGTYWNNNTHGHIKTPNLDQMAAEGSRWTQYYAGDTVCAPSRSALMQGLHTGHSTIRGNAPVASLLPGDITIPMVLKKANYSTYHIGKWGLGDNGTTGIPNLKGFDQYFGVLDQTLAHDYYPETLWNNTKLYYTGNTKGNYTVYADDLFAEVSYSWLTEIVQSENYATQPFFMYIAFTTPHAGGTGTTDETGEPVPSPEPYQNEQWPTVEIDFAAMITRMDGYVGNIFALLKKLQIDQETFVLFASDNGAHNEGGHSYLYFDSSGPLRGFKRSMYDGGIRAPLLAWWPGHVPAGRVDTESYFAAWDLMPTFAELAGIPQSQWPSNIDGMSRLDTLLGNPQPNPDYLYFEFCCNGNFTTAVRSGDWKGVKWCLNCPIELFNVTADIGEQHNVASLLPSVVSTLATIFTKAHTESTTFPSNPCNPGC